MWRMLSVMKSRESEVVVVGGGGRDGRGTSQTATLTPRLLTGGAACQRAMLETPLCPKLVGDPWKLEDSRGNMWESTKAAGPGA